MPRHPYANFFTLCRYDLTLDKNTRLWAADNVYTRAETGERVFSKVFFKASIDEVKTQLDKMPLEQRNVYEVIHHLVPCRLYFDLENKRVDITRIVRIAFGFAKELFGIKCFRVFQLDASTTEKFSNHLIVHMIKEDGTELFFKDVRSVGAFVRRCFVRCLNKNKKELRSMGLTEKDNEYLESIDFGVYTDNRQYRTGGSGKNGGGRHFCCMQGGQKLSPEDTLKIFDKFLVQDHTLTDVATVEVKEANGMDAQSSSLSLERYKKIYIDNEEGGQFGLEEFLEEGDRQEFLAQVVGARKRLASSEPPQVKRYRACTSSSTGPLWPRESLFLGSPRGYQYDEPTDFFGSCIEFMHGETHYDTTNSLCKDLVTCPLGLMTVHWTTMSNEQKSMLACIKQHPLAPSWAQAEKVAYEFIGKNGLTSKSIVQVCTEWLSELTLDSSINFIKSFSSLDEEHHQPVEMGFILGCSQTKTCHKKGSDHKSNKILFVFDIVNAKAIQQCHDKVDCGDKSGVEIILPLKIRYMMFLVKTWRDLYFKVFFSSF